MAPKRRRSGEEVSNILAGWIKEYERPVLNAIGAKGVPRYEIQGVATDVWIKAEKQIATEEDVPNPLAWLILVAQRTAFDYFREEQAQSRLKQRLRAFRQVEVGEDPAIACERKDLAEWLTAKLNCLPVLRRTAFVWRYIEGWTVKEIARELDQPESNVSRWSRETMDYLRKAIKDDKRRAKL